MRWTPVLFVALVLFSQSGFAQSGGGSSGGGGTPLVSGSASEVTSCLSGVLSEEKLEELRGENILALKVKFESRCAVSASISLCVTRHFFLGETPALAIESCVWDLGPVR